MPEKINLNLDNEDNAKNSIIVILTVEEYELFKSACLELLDFYELNRRKIKKVTRILEKLESGKNKNI